MQKEHLQAAAEAFAKLSPLQSDCYHYLESGFSSAIKCRLTEVYTEQLQQRKVRSKHIKATVLTALAECEYPVNVATGYAWTGTQRATFAGIKKQTWSDNKLSEQVNFILDDMARNARTVRAAIQAQITGD